MTFGKGSKHTDESKMKMRLAHHDFSGENNPNYGKKYPNRDIGDKSPAWKGDNAGYHGIHAWVRRYKIKPEFCESCHIKPPYDLANISGKYLRDLDDWNYLCRKCHMDSDDRLRMRHSEETKQKIRIAHLGRKHPWTSEMNRKRKGTHKK